MIVVVVSFESWPAGLAGFTGVSGSVTPHLDRLAARSVVFDAHYVENCDGSMVGHAWWSGRFEFSRGRDGATGSPAGRRLADADIACRLIVPDEQGTSWQQLTGFSEIDVASTSVEGDGFDWQIDRAVDWLACLPPGVPQHHLCWVHATGIQAVNEGDSASRPATIAAQFARIDRALGRLVDAVERPDVLLAVTVGGGTERLLRSVEAQQSGAFPEELVRTSLVVRPAGPARIGQRRGELVQTVDLLPTLLDCFDVDVVPAEFHGRSLVPLIRGEAPEWRRYICLVDGDQARAIRTDDFQLVQVHETAQAVEPDSGEWQELLFSRPDDPWNIVDVLGQYPDQADRLRTTLEQFIAWARSGAATPPPSLSGSASELPPPGSRPGESS